MTVTDLWIAVPGTDPNIIIAQRPTINQVLPKLRKPIADAPAGFVVSVMRAGSEIVVTVDSASKIAQQLEDMGRKIGEDRVVSMASEVANEPARPGFITVVVLAEEKIARYWIDHSAIVQGAVQRSAAAKKAAKTSKLSRAARKAAKTKSRSKAAQKAAETRRKNRQ